MRLIDTRQQYTAYSPQLVQELEYWERNLLKRINQIYDKCDYARFILTIDSGRIILEQIGKPEHVKK